MESSKHESTHLKGLVDSAVTLHLELNVIKVFLAFRLVRHMLAADVGEHAASEKTRDGAFHARALHLAFNVVQQHATELLRVMLHERVERLPPERPCQLFGAHCTLTRLQFEKDALQRQRDTRRRIVALGRHQEDCAAELVGEEECLQQSVHVTGCALKHHQLQ